MTSGRETGPWAAVLWDLDGTLIDTEDYWHAAEVRLAARSGVRGAPSWPRSSSAQT